MPPFPGANPAFSIPCGAFSSATPAGAALWSRPGLSPFPSRKRAFSNGCGVISIAIAPVSAPLHSRTLALRHASPGSDIRALLGGVSGTYIEHPVAFGKANVARAAHAFRPAAASKRTAPRALGLSRLRANHRLPEAAWLNVAEKLREQESLTPVGGEADAHFSLAPIASNSASVANDFCAPRRVTESAA